MISATSTYLGNDGDNIRYGARCPFAAHIRRSNPRDWALATTREKSMELSQLHRIIRRGRPYGPPLDEAMHADRMIELAAGAGESGAEEKSGLIGLRIGPLINGHFEIG